MLSRIFGKFSHWKKVSYLLQIYFSASINFVWSWENNSVSFLVLDWETEELRFDPQQRQETFFSEKDPDHFWCPLILLFSEYGDSPTVTERTRVSSTPLTSIWQPGTKMCGAVSPFRHFLIEWFLINTGTNLTFINNDLQIIWPFLLVWNVWKNVQKS